MMHSGADSLIVGDAHVHLHHCFGLVAFLDAAYANLLHAAQHFDEGRRFIGVLMLTEGQGENGFERLLERLEKRGGTGDADPGGWSLQSTDEAEALILTRGDEERIIIVAGRQIVTQENLEVLAIGTRETFRECLPVEEQVQAAVGVGAIPVIPWGFGKWIGGRRRCLLELIEKPSRPFFFLGDNANRPASWPLPSLFRLAGEAGISNLPGSDPLPFAPEQGRPGKSGFILSGSPDLRNPVRSLKAMLSDQSENILPYNEGESLMRFARNQVAMQHRKRIRRKRVLAS